MICEHCKWDIALRNPSGFCDHLFYPENCKVCISPIPQEKPDWEEKPESRILGYEILFSSGMSNEEIKQEIDGMLRNVHDKKIIAFVHALDHKERLDLIKKATA